MIAQVKQAGSRQTAAPLRERNNRSRLLSFRALYWQAERLACRWDCMSRFTSSIKWLIVDYRGLIVSRSITADQTHYLSSMVRELMDTQEQWLHRESAVIEVQGAVVH